MKRQQLVREVSLNTGLGMAAVERVLGEVLSSITRALQSGDKVKLSRFGNFVPVIRKGKMGRNVVSGSEVLIPDRRYPKFKPSKDLMHKMANVLKSESS